MVMDHGGCKRLVQSKFMDDIQSKFLKPDAKNVRVASFCGDNLQSLSAQMAKASELFGSCSALDCKLTSRSDRDTRRNRVKGEYLLVCCGIHGKNVDATTVDEDVFSVPHGINDMPTNAGKHDKAAGGYVFEWGLH